VGQPTNDVELNTETGAEKYFSRIATPPYLPSPEITPAATQKISKFKTTPGAFQDYDYSNQKTPAGVLVVLNHLQNLPPKSHAEALGYLQINLEL
jgi:hypothetical protein